MVILFQFSLQRYKKKLIYTNFSAKIFKKNVFSLKKLLFL